MLIYDKYLNPLKVDLPITIYGSSSSGNSVYIQPARLLVDLGLPKGHYGDDFKQMDWIAITHRHGDHLNLATLAYVLRVHPQIRFLIPDNVVPKIKEAGLWDALTPRMERLKAKEDLHWDTRDDVRIFLTPYSTKHGDLKNVAFDIDIPFLNTRILYATDLEETEPNPFFGTTGLPDETFNLIMLEANYDEEKLTHIIQGYEDELDRESDPQTQKSIHNDLYRAKSNLRHFSEQQAQRYINTHLTPGGIFIPLHASSTFGTYIQKAFQASAERQSLM